MKEFLRISMILLLLVAYGERSYANYVMIDFNDFSTDKQSFTRGDITISVQSGYTIKKHDSSTRDTFVIPKDANFTISSTAGLIKYILFSFDNGKTALTNWSCHWEGIETKAGDQNLSDGSVYHGTHTASDCFRKSWWRCGDPASSEEGTGKGGVKSYTFKYSSKYYTKYRVNKQYGNGGETHISWMYVFYESPKTNFSISAKSNNTAINDFKEDSKSITANVNFSGSTSNWQNTTMNVTWWLDGVANSTKTETTYSTTANTTIKIKAYVVHSEKLGKTSTSGSRKTYENDFTDLPDYYNSASEPFDITITKYWPVTVGGTGGTNSIKSYYGTFCHNNIMQVPTGWTAYTLKGSKKTGGKIYYQTGKTYAQNSYIPANVPVIVVSSSEGSKNFTNPLNNSADATPPTDAEKCGDFIGNSGYSSKSLSASSTYYYYFLQPDDYSKVGMSFLWKTNNGNDATSVGQHKCYLQIAQSVAKAKAFSVEFLNPDDDTTTDITDIFTEPKAQQPDPDAPRYNLAGQVVGNDYKGIVIQNGRKFLAR